MSIRLKIKTLFCLMSVVFFFFLNTDVLNAQQSGEALFKDLEWRNIGPANMSGRVTDIQALDDDFRHVLVASASGGVWKSTNAGTTWVPIFDEYGSASIGAVAIFPKNPDIIWVGTGEANVRNSVGWGDGMYKSMDGGETFTRVGLEDSHHIARVITHPEDQNIVYAAAQGHLWGYTGQRGLYKTTDGGETWLKLGNGLPDDGKTGCTDIKMDPTDPDVLYTAFWQRLRQPHRFDSGGPNGGLFKSTDGGQTWKKLTEGLPEGDVGRIGIAIYRTNPKIVMAIVEHGFQPRRGTEEYEAMSKLGSGVYRSEDGGETWIYVNRYNNRPFYYSQIYINPNDDDRVYAMGGQAQVSEDGGKTFESGMPGIAGDFHVMWLDPQNKDRYYVGNDKGVSITYDHGEHFNFFDNYAISQIYAVSADMRDPYYVYVGLQDNGIWGGPSNSRDYNGIFNDHWFKFHSGDGFHSAVDPTDWTTVYSESQGGRMQRNHALFRQESKGITPTRTNTLNWEDVVPKQTDSSRPVVRMNWNTPFVLSHHNPHTLYYGANFLFKSVDRGDHWRIISPDLTTNNPEKTLRESGGLTRDVTGAEVHCTLIAISESPLAPGLIWVGTDDGNVQLTRNDGVAWTNVRPNFSDVPESLWVSRVEASHFDKGVCYVTFDGHRSDDFRPYVFKTKDFGQTWENITNNLPDGHSVYVIREDLKNRNLLFVGTEFGVFASIDGGKSWTQLKNGMPTVAAHDLLIHPRAGDLIAGTHGRGVYILDDITPLQQFTEEVSGNDAHLFANPVATKWQGISRGATRGHKLFVGRNPLSMSQVGPSNSPTPIQNTASINFYLSSNLQENAVVEISNLEQTKTRTILLDDEPGIGRYRWDMRFEPTEEQKKSFMKRLENVFVDLEKQVKGKQKKRLNSLHKEFNKADTTDGYNKILRTVMQEFRNYVRGRGFFLRPLQGPEVEAGIYALKMTLDGKSYSGFITIRDDPMLTK
ncbi:MAG: hypothetical protein JSV17_15585 [Candidatus Aminicenantes bacterium]|nr:MAG: hypothetical protein JSV17_15585 [Candidatus Aminicenantes bacterium]